MFGGNTICNSIRNRSDGSVAATRPPCGGFSASAIRIGSNGPAVGTDEDGLISGLGRIDARPSASECAQMVPTLAIPGMNRCSQHPCSSEFSDRPGIRLLLREPARGEQAVYS